MKTPEEIALIGGGILLSSGLVFGLKSGAASELPNVSRSVDTVLQGKKNADSSSSSSSDSANSASQAAAQQKQQQEQAQQQADNAKKQQEEQAQQATQKQQAFENSFDGKYQKAQQNHWQTGQWGTSKYYIDSSNQMNIGRGQLQGSINGLLGSKALDITAINFAERVQAPANSAYLLSTAYSFDNNGSQLTSINNLNNLDTSHSTNMSYFFYNNKKLSNLDASSLNTSSANNIQAMFSEDISLSNLNVHGWNVNNVTNADYAFNHTGLVNLDLSSWYTNPTISALAMFANNYSLQSLNLSNFNTTQGNSNSLESFYNGDTQLSKIIQGNNLIDMNPGNTGLMDSSWQNALSNGMQNTDELELPDSAAEPGVWIRQ